ncbi:proline racemase family protein [Streptomyces sp. STR69]|uniref:proline racemase family protein n=1 Tax=Streptomyces sp. STR69 TaxID=1796942 RepID=UPI0021CA0509|nr:proline racemase family protein [Streptomyces sp. STR69]
MKSLGDLHQCNVTVFVCTVVAETTADGGTEAAVASVTGVAHRCGWSRFTVDPRDPLASGFVLR